ncbi:hypothetical protein DEU56DRAFT_499606 [Suillus clintonianus]|uniref:uncharacterized protein n=1 Tax=Suillus clintonianus TaxID=1904413 RepID=UPI001B86146B|nr:uncharacterized protein DEU56DRAFT_499606 [Suillus clintonianus]KAG2129138.1 hypothetical protein DEU56DRAFT_499606 [Suillus clintonianus]
MADCSCRILTLSSSKDDTLQFLQRLVQGDLPIATDNSSTIIPWTIANKYYTAGVHFEVHKLPDWIPNNHELESVPAVIYTWNAGEPYRENAQMISQRLSHHDFEVSLAIRLPSTTAEDEGAEDDEIDTFLGSLGFEFIDAQKSATSSAHHDHGGVARAIDALSTIMWPSMIQTSSKGRGLGLLATTRDTGEDLSSLVATHTPGGRDRMQQELEELERWLDEDHSDGHFDASEKTISNDPWSAAATTGSLSPTEDSSTQGPHNNAFDDDFTAFLSASASVVDVETQSAQTSSERRVPPLPSLSFSSTFSFDSGSDSSGRSTPANDEHDSSRLHADLGVSYRSLGSVSDFGDPEAEESHKHEDSGDDLPSNAEIAATSERIFGAIPLAFSPTEGNDTRSLQENLPLPSEVEVADPLEADLERFDLQSMLSALQGLKEEIAGMPDSQERKRAAARVALGLVYGLDGNSSSK